jgi:hypothetical protein
LANGEIRTFSPKFGEKELLSMRRGFAFLFSEPTNVSDTEIRDELWTP